jgi:hypothetical protein
MALTFKELKKALNESLFNPKQTSGPLKIILDQKDPNFLEMRALEFINEARLSLTPQPTEHQLAVYNDKIIKAISLLAVARLLRSGSKHDT